jgi:hypothetical protein
MPANAPAINDLNIQALGTPTLTLGGGTPTMTPTSYYVVDSTFNQSLLEEKVINNIGYTLGRIVNEDDLVGTITIQIHTSGSIPSFGATGSIAQGYAPTGSAMTILTIPTSKASTAGIAVPTLTLNAYRKLS